MKILTIVGTRPELIRLSRIIPLLDKYCDHTFLHTGQNYDPNLGDIFYNQMEIRRPDIQLDCVSITDILDGVEEQIIGIKPDRILILGDTNSGLAAIVAKRRCIPICHMEAGNRCYDDSVPEEINRRIIDTCSDILMPYTERSGQNLIREGYAPNKIFVTGNPIFEVISHYNEQIQQSRILIDLNLIPKGYYLVTLHRSENVDNPIRLTHIIHALHHLSKEMPVIISAHPHLKLRMDNTNKDGLQFCEPFGFFDFVKLEKNAACVLSDSGTVQEETAILGLPNVTLRNVTERPETIESGSGILTGFDPETIVRCVKIARENVGNCPSEYFKHDVSKTVVKIVLGEL
jgi:UDP-N-acetylglucosamine 2-epimerase (non-hydrolysing)